MKVKYFVATHPTFVEFSEKPPVEMRELNENVYIELDSDGLVVSLTIEHARQAASMEEFSYQRIPAATPAL